MSTFTGILFEYPYISIDCFNDDNILSSVYFLSHCHKDHIRGLLDDAFLERLKKGNPDVKLYTSETTRNLMSCDQEMSRLMDYVVGLPVNQQCQLDIIREKENIKETLVVTLISAGHCVGSVMFLLEGKNGKVLYTGDFRLSMHHIKKISSLHTTSSVIKSVYVDTTFCVPKIPDLPTREETKRSLIEIIARWIKHGPHYIVHLKCKGRYGYEYIMKEVSKHFEMKIHVNSWRLKMSAKLPHMLECFTTNPSETQIHSCYFGMGSNNSYYNLPCRLQTIKNQPIKIITVVPSSLYFLQNDSIPKDGKLWIGSKKLWRVFHSMHASYNEIRDLVGYLQPENIYPCVPPVDNQNIVVAYNRLQDLKSSSSEMSDESSQEETTVKNGTEFSKSKKDWSKDLNNVNLLSPKSDAAYLSNIGLSDDLSFSSPPRKVRKKLISTPRQSDMICSELDHSLETQKHTQRKESSEEDFQSDIDSDILQLEQKGTVGSNVGISDSPTTTGIMDGDISNVKQKTNTEKHHVNINNLSRSSADDRENDSVQLQQDVGFDLAEESSFVNFNDECSSRPAEKVFLQTDSFIVISDDSESESESESERTLTFSEISDLSETF